MFKLSVISKNATILFNNHVEILDAIARVFNLSLHCSLGLKLTVKEVILKIHADFNEGRCLCDTDIACVKKYVIVKLRVRMPIFVLEDDSAISEFFKVLCGALVAHTKFYLRFTYFVYKTLLHHLKFPKFIL